MIYQDRIFDFIGSDESSTDNDSLFYRLGLDKKDFFEIQNRRYLGNKYRLIFFIKRVISEEIGEFNSFCDIFAGTGSVGYSFNQKNNTIISNDLLLSNFTTLNTFLGIKEVNYKLIKEKIDFLNELNTEDENYFSTNFGGLYFSLENAKKIGKIREEIDRIILNAEEKNILLTSLIYAIDKIANTVGHYDAYRKTEISIKTLKLLLPKIEYHLNENNIVIKQDANILINNIYSDILYIDPPYNSRQYNSSYHLLENLIKWEKPDVFGVAKKMEMKDTKSKYCTKEAQTSFADLINLANCRYIVVSYNNTANTMNKRSNALISDNFIIEILKAKGNVKIFERDYKGFTTGKSENKANKERLFVCKVR